MNRIDGGAFLEFDALSGGGRDPRQKKLIKCRRNSVLICPPSSPPAQQNFITRLLLDAISPTLQTVTNFTPLNYLTSNMNIVAYDTPQNYLRSNMNIVNHQSALGGSILRDLVLRKLRRIGTGVFHL